MTGQLEPIQRESAVSPRPTPVLEARGLVRTYGKVVALDHCDFEKLSSHTRGFFVGLGFEDLRYGAELVRQRGHHPRNQPGAQRRQEQPTKEGHP